MPTVAPSRPRTPANPAPARPSRAAEQRHLAPANPVAQLSADEFWTRIGL